MLRSVKLISLLLAVFMMLAMLVGCADEQIPDETTGAPDNTTGEPVGDTTAAVVTEEVLELPPAQDFGGATVTFYSRYYNGVWKSDLMADDDDTDTLLVAVNRRNKMIEERYKVKLDEIQSGTATFKAEVERRISTGDTSFDVMCLGVPDASGCAADGYLIDMCEIDQINLDGKWWSATCNERFRVGGRQFFATGDITTLDNMNSRGVFFNKKMIEQHGLTSPYDYVENNAWTFEQMFNMGKECYIAVDGGTDPMKNTYGVSAQTSLGFIMLMAAGETISKNNDQGIPELTIGNDRFYAVLDHLTSLISGNESVFRGADADVMALFRQGQAMFMPEVLYHIITLRDSEIDFGIVPAPKYNSEQKDYCSFGTAYGTTAICFPMNNTGDRLERAATVVEAMAIQSVSTVTPAYIEVSIKSRFAPDVTAGKMIGIISDTVTPDLAEIYAWGGLRSKLQDGIANGSSIANVIKSSKKLAENQMKITIEALKKVPSIKN